MDMAPSRKTPRQPAAKIENTRVPPHPNPADPQHEDWLVDEADDESFPASDPSSATQPKPKPAGKR
jgi:hypothetical protein